MIAGAVIVSAVLEIPVPLNPTLSVPFTGSLLVMVTVADRAPTADGVNATSILHVLAGFKVPVHASNEVGRLKSPGLVPVTAIVKSNGVVPELERITV